MRFRLVKSITFTFIPMLILSASQACQQSSLVDSKSQLLGSNKAGPSQSDLEDDKRDSTNENESEAVVAPTPVHGAYIGGQITAGNLNESTELQISLGLWSIFDGMPLSIQNQVLSISWGQRIAIRSQEEQAIAITGSMTRSMSPPFQRDLVVASSGRPLGRQDLSDVSVSVSITLEGISTPYTLQASLNEILSSYENQQQGYPARTTNDALQLYPQENSVRIEWQANDSIVRYRLLRTLDSIQLSDATSSTESQGRYYIIYDGEHPGSYVEDQATPNTRYLYQLWGLNESGEWVRLLSEATLTGKFANTNHLAGQNLAFLDLLEVDFSGSDLRGSILMGSDISRASLAETQLSGATWLDGRICADGSHAICQ